jgi:hypothetical protein
MRNMRNIIAITLLFLSTQVNAQSEIYLDELDDYQTAIVSSETGKTLFVETIDDDKQILGYGTDFFVVYRKSTNKIYVKSTDGKIISGMTIPKNCYLEVINFEGMTEYEMYDVKESKEAFFVVNIETGEKSKYNKHCVFIGKLVIFN